MGPKRGHSCKFVQQFSRKVPHIRIEIIPNNFSLVTDIKIRLKEIKVYTAYHCKE
jgi:hypothetical protein